MEIILPPGLLEEQRVYPLKKSNIAVMYSLAAQYLGMRFVYLEAGSGAKKNVSAEMISNVRKYYDGLLIVGGGIKNFLNS